MRFSAALIFVTSTFAAVAFAADAQLLKLIPGEAQVIAGVDAGRVKGSPFGQYLLAQLSAHEPQLESLETLTGFNPRRDVSEIVLAASGPSRKKGVVLLRGAFDKGKILGMLSARGQAPAMYQGVEILANPQGGEAMALVDSTLLMLGDTGEVKAALDRRGQAGGLEAGLAAKIDQLSAAHDVWMVSKAPVSEFAGVVEDRHASGMLKGDLWKKIRQASGGIKFGSMVTMAAEAEAQTAQDAAALADVARFFVGMFQLQSPQNVPEPIAKMFRNASVTSAGNTVKVNFEMPSVELETLVQGLTRRQGRRAGL